MFHNHIQTARHATVRKSIIALAVITTISLGGGIAQAQSPSHMAAQKISHHEAPKMGAAGAVAPGADWANG